MDINSPNFLFLLLPVFLLAYYLVPQRGKLVVGIAGSLLFYAWGNLLYVPLLIGLTLTAYFLARGIDRWRSRKVSLFLLWAGILINISLLVGFKLWTGVKYPLGLSYVTFQVIAYLLETYNKVSASEKDILAFSFYLLLFPKIPVGPITRYRQLREQINNIQIDPTDAADGLRRYMRGFAKKALIADTLARVVVPIFKLSSPVVTPAIAWLVILSYSLQLYFDFSGYTDMAIGLGRMMGFRFLENFNFPYISRSIGDFWRRWHISLSNWFRDFVFYPLERRRLKWIGQPLNILIVFALTGLWHGLTKTFLAWGLIHGLALIFESTSIGKKLRTLWAPIQHVYALSVILVGWVFFRSPSLGFAVDFLLRLLGDMRGLQTLPFELTSPLPFIEPTFVLALLSGILFSLPINDWVQAKADSFSAEKPALKITFQLAYDLGLAFIFLAAIASSVSAAFLPGIYGTF